jgi:hypothetical protein
VITRREIATLGGVFWSPHRNAWFYDIATATDNDLGCALAQFDHTVNHMGKRVWDRAPVPPLYALDRPVLPKAGKAPPCRLVRLNKRITRPDRPSDLYFDANVLTWRGEWLVRPTGVVTGPSRIAAIWADLPMYPEWKEVRQRIRLAAQLGTYITAELPEGYR